MVSNVYLHFFRQNKLCFQAVPGISYRNFKNFALFANSGVFIMVSNVYLSCTEWYGEARCATMRYWMVRSSTGWYGLVRGAMVWYGVVRRGTPRIGYRVCPISIN